MKLPKEEYKLGYSENMKKSGKTNRYEPTDTSCTNDFLECVALFKRECWFNFFEKITGFNLEVSYHFTQNFIKDTVTFDTLKFELKEELILKLHVYQERENYGLKISLSALTQRISCYQRLKP